MIRPQRPYRGGARPGGVTGAVLAGGAARRMRSDKRALLIDGRPLLALAAAAVATVSDELLVACRPDSPPDLATLANLATVTSLDPRVVVDRVADGGPLAGLEAALGAARWDTVLVVAADMPGLAVPVLRRLLEEAERAPDADAVLLESDRGAEPLIGVYRRSALATARRLLGEGERRMSAFVTSLHVRLLPAEEWRSLDPEGTTLVNLNDPADVEDWRRKLEAAHSASGPGSSPDTRTRHA